MAVYPLTLINPGAETGDTTGWTPRSGGLPSAVTVTPHTGSYCFVSSLDASTAQWDQQVEIDPAHHAGIDTGTWQAMATAWLRAHQSDTGALYIEAVAADGTTVLKRAEGDQRQASDWVQVSRGFTMPVGTRFLRIGTSGVREAGTELNAYWDDFALEISDEPYSVDLIVGSGHLQHMFSPEDTDLIVGHADVQVLNNPLTKPFLHAGFAVLQEAHYPLVKPHLNCTVPFLQYMIRAPETFMAEKLFPASADSSGDGGMMLRGTSYSTHARPSFSTKVAQHTGGRETATAYWDSPKWEFELSFDWLPNKSLQNNTDFKTLCGFFLSRRGRFEDFLFRAPDDYRVEDLLVGTGDGLEPTFPLFRPMGEYEEPIGQVDPDSLTVWLEGEFNKSVPLAPGPYDINFDREIDELYTVSIAGVALTDVSPNPPASENEYSRVGSIFTFFSSRAGQEVTFSCKYEAKTGPFYDYDLAMPRTLSFYNAPDIGTKVWATFEFFFVCRFLEDQKDFEQFSHRLWQLGEMTLRSVPT